MRKLLVLLPLLVLPMTAWGADPVPKVELFGGYSNLTANLNASNFNLNGADFSVTENMNSWFGGTLDISTHFGTENGFKTNTQSATYGPVFSYRKNPRIVPFGHALLGAVRGGPEYLNISKPENRFGVYLGGGLDVRVTRNIALRLIQADYLMTRFSSARQDNMRLSAGIVLLLGKKK
jgi:opacity protein-like surface antigen